MDVFNRVKYDESFDYVLKDPKTGEDTDIIIKIKSIGNEEAKKIDLKILNEFRSNQIQGKEVSIEYDLENTYEKLASCVAGWSDTLVENGTPLPYTKENVHRLLRLEWFFKQVNKFAGEIENFM